MIVKGLHQRFVFGRRVRRLADHLAPLVPDGATVLDIGCGDGTLAASIMERRSDVTITGVDVLVRPGARIAVKHFDGAHLPYADNSFDVALFVDVLHHTDDPIVLLREAQRVARRAVIIKDHALYGLGAGLTLAVMDWIGNAHHGVRLPYTYWTPTQWRDAFAELGLDVSRYDRSLELYPRPFSWLFDRQLHFIAVLSSTVPLSPLSSSERRWSAD